MFALLCKKCSKLTRVETLIVLSFIFIFLFSGYSMQKSILGLRFCFLSTIIFAVVAPYVGTLLTVYIPGMPLFLGSIIDRHVTPQCACYNIPQIIVLLIQPWLIFVLSSLMAFLIGSVFLGTVFCVISYLSCLAR